MGIGNHEKPNRGSTDIWLTPLSIIKGLGEFDLDPCGWRGHKTAKHSFYERGLNQKWFGRVWLNPPYSEVKDWLNCLFEHGNGIALVFARLDTKWAQSILPLSDSVFFPEGRIKFLKEDFSYPKYTSGAPSMFLSFGEKPDWGKTGLKGWIAK